jgi:hypothetical protein
MSETITHTAVLDDALRLAQASPEICAPFKDVAQAYRDFARLGSVTRGGDRHIPPILERLRAEWEGRSPEQQLEPRLAYLLGWMCHRATDRQMKPIFRAVDRDCPRSPTDCSIYHDAFLFRTIYADDPDSPFGQAMFEVNVGAVKELMRALLQASLIELHTLTPDREDAWGWLGRLFALHEGFQVELERYAEAIVHPDPDKVRRFIDAVDFYGAEEPVIAAARRLQRGESVAPEQVASAAAAPPRSHYAQALQRSYAYLRSASAFFTSDMDIEGLKAQLDVGVLGRDGIAV